VARTDASNPGYYLALGGNLLRSWAWQTGAEVDNSGRIAGFVTNPTYPFFRGW
jgi:hypothetical protein